MKKLLIAAFAGLIATATSASAQNMTIGSSQQGSSSYLTGAAVAKVVSEATDMNLRVVPEGGSEIILSRLHAGDMVFGIATSPPLLQAWRGGEEYKGVKQENVRVIAVLRTLRTAFMVRADSDIKSTADFAGKRIAEGFGRQRAAGLMQDAGLAAAGVQKDGLTLVPVAGGAKAIDDLIAGRLDITHFSLASGKTREADSSIGIRFLTIPDTEAAKAAASESMPGVFIETVQPSAAYPGFSEPINVIASKYLLVTNAAADEDAVYAAVKALHDNKDSLVAAYAAMGEFDPENMHLDLGVPYHPGALKFYAEIGQ